MMSDFFYLDIFCVHNKVIVKRRTMGAIRKPNIFNSNVGISKLVTVKKQHNLKSTLLSKLLF